jgi:hypothetical protein
MLLCYNLYIILCISNCSAEEQYDNAIITSESIKNNSTMLDNFIHHKYLDCGHKILVVTEKDFLGLVGQFPNHRAEKIRQWLKDHKSSLGIKYVLLIGDPTPYNDSNKKKGMCRCNRFGQTILNI